MVILQVHGVAWKGSDSKVIYLKLDVCSISWDLLKTRSRNVLFKQAFYIVLFLQVA